MSGQDIAMYIDDWLDFKGLKRSELSGMSAEMLFSFLESDETEIPEKKPKIKQVEPILVKTSYKGKLPARKYHVGSGEEG